MGRYGLEKDERVKRQQIAKEYGIVIEEVYLPRATELRKRLKNLENYGFSKKEIIEMVRKLPPILSYTAERTGKLIEWFRFHQIEIDLARRPFHLIFSINTLESRQQKLEILGFDYQTNPSPMFYSKKQWEKFLAKITP